MFVADRQTSSLSSGLGMVSSCEEKLIQQSDQLASQKDHMRGPGSTHLGMVWVSRSMFIYIYVCVSVRAHLVSAHSMVVCENRKL